MMCDRKTGIFPVSADSASGLSPGKQTSRPFAMTAWKAVFHFGQHAGNLRFHRAIYKVAPQQMKRLIRIFELAKNEQRVVLIVMLVLVAIAFIGYEHRVHHTSVQPTSSAEAKSSPSPAENQDEQ
jgi:hypothetical protein